MRGAGAVAVGGDVAAVDAEGGLSVRLGLLSVIDSLKEGRAIELQLPSKSPKDFRCVQIARGVWAHRGCVHSQTFNQLPPDVPASRWARGDQRSRKMPVTHDPQDPSQMHVCTASTLRSSGPSACRTRGRNREPFFGVEPQGADEHLSPIHSLPRPLRAPSRIQQQAGRNSPHLRAPCPCPSSCRRDPRSWTCACS